MAERPFPGIDEGQLLSDEQRSFLAECREMVERFSDRLPDGLHTSARIESFRGDDQLLLEVSDLDSALTIETIASADEVIVAMSEADEWSNHWHFAPHWNDVYGPVPDRSWRSLAVDFVAELLQGEVRVRVTYRGGRPVKVHTEVTTSDGESLTEGTTGALTLNAMRFWAKRRAEDRNVRFGGP